MTYSIFLFPLPLSPSSLPCTCSLPFILPSPTPSLFLSLPPLPPLSPSFLLFVLPLLPSSLAIVGHCDLSSSDVESVLKRHCQSNRMRGIRQILNYHPDNMIYSEAPHDNFLTDPQWLKGLALLEKYNLSFEMHVLPRQMHR